MGTLEEIAKLLIRLYVCYGTTNPTLMLKRAKILIEETQLLIDTELDPEIVETAKRFFHR